MLKKKEIQNSRNLIIYEKDKEGDDTELYNKRMNPEDEYVIGREVDPIKISKDPTVGPSHCAVKLDKANSFYWFTSLPSDYGSFFKIPRNSSYSDFHVGMTVLMGEQRITLEKMSQEQNFFHICSKSYPFSKTKDPITIGKKPECTIQKPEDIYLSKEHGKFILNESGENYTVYDTGSKNGTWIKVGVKTLCITPPSEFRIGDNTYLKLE